MLDSAEEADGATEEEVEMVELEEELLGTLEVEVHELFRSESIVLGATELLELDTVLDAEAAATETGVKTTLTTAAPTAGAAGTELDELIEFPTEDAVPELDEEEEEVFVED